MKRLFPFLALLCLIVVFQVTGSSCTKTNSVTNTVMDTVVVVQPDNSVFHLLMGKQWQVDSLYYNYAGPNTGTLIYARGGANNSQDLSNVYSVFWPDGGQLFYNGYGYYDYHFVFRDADSANLLIQNVQPDYVRIVQLTTTRLTLFDSTSVAISYYSLKH